MERKRRSIRGKKNRKMLEEMKIRGTRTERKVRGKKRMEEGRQGGERGRERKTRTTSI